MLELQTLPRAEKHEKSTLGKVIQTDRRPFGSPLVLPRCSPGLPRPFCPVSGPTLSRTHSWLPQGALSVEDLRCLTVVSCGIREPSGVKGGVQQPPPAVPEIPVYHKHARMIWITSAGWHAEGGSVLTGHHGTPGKDDRSIFQEE